MKRAVQIDEKDNVATATSDLSPGEVVEVHSPTGNIVLRPEATKTSSCSLETGPPNICWAFAKILMNYSYDGTRFSIS
jgi:hypothetical protein